MRNSNERPEGETPASSAEEQLGCFLEEAMNLARSGSPIDVAVLLADQPDLMARGRHLGRGVLTAADRSFSRSRQTPYGVG